MPKYDFKATLLKSHFGINLLHIFRTPFFRNASEELLNGPIYYIETYNFFQDLVQFLYSAYDECFTVSSDI